MKNLLSKILIIFLFSIALGGKAYADHLGAMDIYVDWKGKFRGDYTYKVTLIIYRSCTIIPQNLKFFTDSQQVEITSPSCNITLPPLKVDTVGNDSLKIVDQLCPSFHNINSCFRALSPWPGFEKWTYTGYVTLPQQCTDWTFSFNSCCRNLSVVNLNSAGIYVRTIINNLANDTVSSPRFYVDPIPYICANQQASFFNGPVDPDGDSIITLNQVPYGGVNVIGTYNPGFTANAPINSSTPYTVDPVSGVANFNPQTTGQYILAFTCNKYDHLTGALLASTERDVQVSILNCASPPPSIDSLPSNVVNGGTTFGNTIVTCPNSTLSFDITGRSQSNSNAVYMSCDPGTIKTSTFSVANQASSKPVGTFSWTPTTNDYGSHVVVFTAVDSTCTSAQPIVFKAYTVITIKVFDGIVALPKDYYSCGSLNKPIQLNVSNYGYFNYSWTDINGSTSTITDPNVALAYVFPPYTTQYVVSVTNGPPGCKNTDTVTVHVDTNTHIKISPIGTATSPIIFCQPGILNLSETPSGLQPYKNLPCGLVDVNTTPLTQEHDSTFIIVDKAKLTTTPGNLTTPFGNFVSQRHQYLVKASDMRYSGMYSSSLTGIGFNISATGNNPAPHYDSVTISLKCTKLPLDPNGQFVNGTSQVYSGPVNISGVGLNKINFKVPYNWDSTMDLIVDICVNSKTALPVSPCFPNSYHTVYQSHIGAYSGKGDVCNGVIADSIRTTLDSLPQMEFFFDHVPLAGYTISWERMYGSNLLSDSSSPNPTLFVNASSKYRVNTFSRSGCYAYDSIYVFLDDHHPTITPVDTSICVGRSVNISVSNGNVFQWYQNGFDPTNTLSCTDCGTPVAKPFDTTKYTVVVTDSVQCIDTLYSNVNILALPVFNVTPHDTTIKYGSQIRLHVSNDTLDYVWSPISTLDNPYSSSPIAKPFEPTVYTIVGSLNNCSWTDTVRVGIDYSANLLVPSVFSPNHDGKNDRFRVAGLTFQKVIEFRVFNRMGQELYNATDNEGWDGTFNKEEQDIDTYFYFIRVAYPDGYIQNFKGDVTLLR